MKETLIQVLQQRMDKCTTEQFWAVAVLTGLDAFVLTNSMAFADLPSWPVTLAVAVAGASGIWYLISRHREYYRCRAAMSALFSDEGEAPGFLKSSLAARNPQTWLGTGLYVLWVLGGLWAVLWTRL